MLNLTWIHSVSKVNHTHTHTHTLSLSLFLSLSLSLSLSLTPNPISGHILRPQEFVPILNKRSQRYIDKFEPTEWCLTLDLLPHLMRHVIGDCESQSSVKSRSLFLSGEGINSDLTDSSHSTGGRGGSKKKRKRRRKVQPSRVFLPRCAMKGLSFFQQCMSLSTPPQVTGRERERERERGEERRGGGGRTRSISSLLSCFFTAHPNSSEFKWKAKQSQSAAE